MNQDVKQIKPEEQLGSIELENAIRNRQIWNSLINGKSVLTNSGKVAEEEDQLNFETF